MSSREHNRSSFVGSEADTVTHRSGHPLLNEALVYLQQLSRQARGDVELERELAEAYMRVGDVLGEPNGSSLGDLKGALASYRRGLALWQALAEQYPNDPEILHAYANALS